MFNQLPAGLSSFFEPEENKTTVRTEVLAMGYTYSRSPVVVSPWCRPGVDISGLCGALVALVERITRCVILLCAGKWCEAKALTAIAVLVFAARYAFITLG